MKGEHAKWQVQQRTKKRCMWRDVFMVCHSLTSPWVCLMLIWHVAHLFVKFTCLSIRPSVSTSCVFCHPFIREHISSHASLFCSLLNLSFCMFSLHSSHLLSHHVCWFTYTCSHSWRDNIKSKNLLVYHDTWSFRMNMIGRGNHVARWDDGSWHYWWKLRKSHWVMKMGNPSRQWLFARSGSGGRKNCTNFWRDSLGCKKAR